MKEQTLKIIGKDSNKLILAFGENHKMESWKQCTVKIIEILPQLFYLYFCYKEFSFLNIKDNFGIEFTHRRKDLPELFEFTNPEDYFYFKLKTE